MTVFYWGPLEKFPIDNRHPSMLDFLPKFVLPDQHLICLFWESFTNDNNEHKVFHQPRRGSAPAVQPVMGLL